MSLLHKHFQVIPFTSMASGNVLPVERVILSSCASTSSPTTTLSIFEGIAHTVAILNSDYPAAGIQMPNSYGDLDATAELLLERYQCCLA